MRSLWQFIGGVAHARLNLDVTKNRAIDHMCMMLESNLKYLNIFLYLKYLNLCFVCQHNTRESSVHWLKQTIYIENMCFLSHDIHYVIFIVL